MHFVKNKTLLASTFKLPYIRNHLISETVLYPKPSYNKIPAYINMLSANLTFSDLRVRSRVLILLSKSFILS